MPNRIIKESIWTSPNLNQLSDLAERHFYRILVLPDDFGCCEVTALVVKGRCYPLKPDILGEEIDAWQQELEDKGLIIRWNDNGRQYAVFPSFDKHQRIRSLHQRKTPIPPDEVVSRLDGSCRQVTANDRPNPNPNPNPNPTPLNPPATSSQKKTYGEFNNVLLSEEELQKLKDKFGAQAEPMIEKLSSYMESHGKRYKSHYATLLNWSRRDDGKTRLSRDLPKTYTPTQDYPDL